MRTFSSVESLFCYTVEPCSCIVGELGLDGLAKSGDRCGGLSYLWQLCDGEGESGAESEHGHVRQVLEGQAGVVLGKVHQHLVLLLRVGRVAATGNNEHIIYH